MIGWIRDIVAALRDRPRNRREDRSPADCGMKVIEQRQVGPNVWEVTTESERYGRVTRRVLILPESQFKEP